MAANGGWQQNTVFAIRKSILDHSSKTNVGELFLSYGDSHMAAGTCQVANDRADNMPQELIVKITTDG